MTFIIQNFGPNLARLRIEKGVKTPFLFVSQTETSKLFIYFIDIFYKNKYNSFIRNYTI